MWYYSRLEVDILVRKNSLVINWYIFFGLFIIFNVIVNRLITFKTLKKQKIVGLCPRPQATITIASQSLCPLLNSIFFHKTDIS